MSTFLILKVGSYGNTIFIYFIEMLHFFVKDQKYLWQSFLDFKNR